MTGADATELVAKNRLSETYVSVFEDVACFVRNLDKVSVFVDFTFLVRKCATTFPPYWQYT